MKFVYADGKSEYDALFALRERNEETDKAVSIAVEEIIKEIKQKGDEALLEYTRKFDCENITSIEVSKEMIDDALNSVDAEFLEALKRAKANIEKYHQNQKRTGFCDVYENGSVIGQKVRGLSRVGLYVPGGTAAYPSSVLMNAIPAKIAGVGEIVMVTPPKKDGTANKDILAAAAICGVDRIFLVGGAQAVAALAFGTETIPQVDKIVGPGNIFVATAKKQLFGVVDIDMIAGPSEILVIADETANPSYLAADLMSQAEHDKLASSILITTSEDIAKETLKQIDIQAEKLSRKDIIKSSLDNYGLIIVCDDIKKAFELSNAIAPEHLEIMTKDAMSQLGMVQNAGSVFLGRYSPEPLGDYYAGPNHVLPTSGTARFFSPLSVDSFVKKMSYICYTEEALSVAKDDIVKIAEREGLTAHANSITVRF
ncbi:MAG: histidinol dehydrogenase [Oscillospiraceae bacterium]|nr:histidinol dehydrogenase [Oscillospiraceae bacterium]